MLRQIGRAAQRGRWNVLTRATRRMDLRCLMVLLMLLWLLLLLLVMKRLPVWHHLH